MSPAAVYLPKDGQGDPGNIAQALARGARLNGAKVIEGVRVTDIQQASGRVTGVSWSSKEDQGSITADYVVNCGGMWAHQIGRLAGVTVPLHACEHFYIVTESDPGTDATPCAARARRMRLL